MTSARLLDLGARLAQALASEGGHDALLGTLDRGEGLLLLDTQRRPIARTESAPQTFPSELPADGEPARFADGSLAVPLRVGERRLGWLLAFGAKARRSDEDSLRLAATLLALDLTRERSAPTHRDLWDEALAGRITDAASVKALAAEQHLEIAAAYLVVALAFEETSIGPELTELGAIACAALGERAIVQRERNGALLLLVPAIDEPAAGKIRVAATLLPKSIARRNPTYRIVGGIGGTQPVHALERASREALAALEIARRLGRRDSVLPYERLGALPLLLESAATPEWRDFARTFLEPIRDYDAKHQTELERTMSIYFESGENVKTAAERLHVHRHTVFYRLRQIAELTGLSLESSFDQLNLRLAVTIDAFDS
ncbi:MAG: PucR family transcriptional regulator [Candidatus Baltobacteraceae bacterium]